MVINQGINDQWFIFRGQDGRDFLAGLHLLHTRPVKLVLANGRRVNGELAVTGAHTFALSLPVDDLKEWEARHVFEVTVGKFIGELMTRHGRS